MGSINQNSFDAWGRSRNPNKWNYDMRYKREMPLPELTTRGYTGHEHLNQFQLINMNGRLYDPITKQMSQPDIHTQDPYSTQSYNRYAYCMNNPLKYTDPSGYVYRGYQGDLACLFEIFSQVGSQNGYNNFTERGGFLDVHTWGGIEGLSPIKGGTGIGEAPDTRSDTEKIADDDKKAADEKDADGVPPGGILFYKEDGTPLRVTGQGDKNVIYVVNDEDVSDFLVEYISELLFSNGDFRGLADKYGSNSYDVNVNADGTSVSGVVNAPWYMYVAMGATVMGEGIALRKLQRGTPYKGLSFHYGQSSNVNIGITNAWNQYLNVPRQFQPWW